MSGSLYRSFFAEGVSWIRNEKNNGEKLVSDKALPLLFEGRENICQHSIILPTYPGKMGPPNFPPTTPKKEFFQKLLVKHPGYLRGGPVGEILETSSKDPIRNSLLAFEKITSDSPGEFSQKVHFESEKMFNKTLT